MEANIFLSKIKADGSGRDTTNLDQVIVDYKDILTKLAGKDRGPFSLNVLCVLCRNLEKVPSWRSQISNKALLNLSIECVRETRGLASNDRVKTLGCIYHLHKHVVRQNAPVTPELVLKFSYMPFEDNLLAEYAKTYWNILADRITFIEKLKTKVPITKLLPKLNEDIIKVIDIFNTVQFCQTILSFLIKKLHYLFNENSLCELNNVFGKIFEAIRSKTDMKTFKKLQDKELLEIYVRLNECLYVIAENCLKLNNSNRILNRIVQTCITIVGHSPDLLHCLQNIYLNGFCSILIEEKEQNLAYTETILDNFVTTCKTMEKLGYTRAMLATYPFINQFLRLYIENTNKSKLTDGIIVALLKMMLFLAEKLKNCQQILKCENCNVRSGLHDALRLTFLAKNFISNEISCTKIMASYFSVVLQQYELLRSLCAMGCSNYEKCYKKLQSDVHNTAITLNKLQHFEHSIKLFDIYLRNEILHFKNDSHMKNISRALYNKGICELDAKQYENALSDAYLSLVFAYPEGLTTEKYMSLVMDIKAKVLKVKDEELCEGNSVDEIQMMTVLDVCADSVENKKYGCLKPFFCNLKFSDLLKHEFDMYVKLWPSIVPIAGVWKTMHDLTQHDVPWSTANDEDIKRILFEVILETPTAVRSIHNDQFAEITRELVDSFNNIPPETMEQKIFFATLLFLKSEFDLADACQKYGWKVTELNTDPDQMQVNRTISQEHEATMSAIQAVDLWTDIVKRLDEVPRSILLHHSLQIIQVSAASLLHLSRTLPALQMYYICCKLAQYLQDKEAYIRNVSVIIYHADKQTDELTSLLTIASGYCKEVLQKPEMMDTAFVYLCDCAIFYQRIGLTAMSAKLMRFVQAKILMAVEKYPEVDLQLSTGRLLIALSRVRSPLAPSALSAYTAAHRYHLAITNHATKHTTRRLRALTLKCAMSWSGVSSCRVAMGAGVARRGRSAAAACARAAAATALATLAAVTCNTSAVDDAQIRIDNRLKYILGLQVTAHQPITVETDAKKSHYPQRQELETMLENMTFKTLNSPTSCPSIATFNLPEFLTHENCKCYACSNKVTAILTCQTIGLEASMYFRAKEFGVARNYFDGALKCCYFVEKILKEKYCGKFEGFLVSMVNSELEKEFATVKIEILMEAAFFELSQNDLKATDGYVVRIHEMLQENGDVSPYLRNEVLNLMVASANMRRGDSKKEIDALGDEFDNLKLSPAKTADPPKTPEAKAEKPPKLTKIKVKDEDLPNTKRKVIKLNLDEASCDENENSKPKRSSRKNAFKIPVPVTVQPVLESITPTPRRKNPAILVTQPSSEVSVTEFATPLAKASKSEFFTPMETPSEQFFTPMSSVRTYSKKSLRHGIVKNLESEFSTPKSVKKTSNPDVALKSDQNKLETKTQVENINKENVQRETKARSRTKVETGSLKTIKDKRSLKRATSPGKLDKTEQTTRSRRQPIRFSSDDSSGK